MAAAANDPELSVLKQHTRITSHPGGLKSEQEAASEGGRGWQGRCPAFLAAVMWHRATLPGFYHFLSVQGLWSWQHPLLLLAVPPSTPLPG